MTTQTDRIPSGLRSFFWPGQEIWGQLGQILSTKWGKLL